MTTLSVARQLHYNAGSVAGVAAVRNGSRIGPPATFSCEPGQARKGAAAAVNMGAGVWLVRFAAIGRDWPPACATLRNLSEKPST